MPIIITLASLGTGIALAIGGIDVLGGAISAGTLVAFLAYSRHFFDPIEELGGWFAEMQMAQASAERILGLIDARAEVRDRVEEELRIRPADGYQIEAIELRDVGFSYAWKPPRIMSALRPAEIYQRDYCVSFRRQAPCCRWMFKGCLGRWRAARFDSRIGRERERTSPPSTFSRQTGRKHVS